MSLRPLDVPIIATNATYASGPDAGGATKNAPSLALLQDGWRPEDEPDAREWNHVENAQSRALAYLDAIDVSNLNAASHDWNEAVFGFANVPDVRTPYCIGYRYPGEIVVVGSSAGTSSAAVSRNDGKGWYEEVLTGLSDPVRGVAFVGAGTLAAEAGFAVTDGSQAAFYTPGGGWTLTAPANQLTGAGVIPSPGAAATLLSFGGTSTGPGVWRSNGGAATQCTVPALAGHVMREVAWGGTGVGFLGISDNGAVSATWTSLTGATWVNVGVNPGGPVVRVAWDALRARWVRAGANGIGFATSPDGVTWTNVGGLPGPLVFDPGHSVRRLLVRGGVWIAVTTAANAGVKIAWVWTSRDGGANWVRCNAAVLHSSVTSDVAAMLGEGTNERLYVARATSLSVGLRAR